MIYDAVLHRDELDCLRIRLDELKDVVDRTIIVEGNRTFQGAEKRLEFDRHAHWFRRWPIDYVAVTDWPDTSDPWALERHQRNSIGLGLGDAADDDLVLVSDADEIPSAAGVRKAIELLNRQACFVHSMRMYYVNLKATRLEHPGTQLTTVGYLRQVGAETIRANRNIVEDRITDGWHFCNLGDAEWLAGKLASYAHTEHRDLADVEFLRGLIRDQRVIDGSDLGFVVDNDLPQCLRRKRFKHLFVEGVA